MNRFPLCKNCVHHEVSIADHPCADCQRSFRSERTKPYFKSKRVRATKPITNTADVRPVVRGTWIEHNFRTKDGVRYTGSLECPLCGRFVMMRENFCPECGTDMRPRAVEGAGPYKKEEA